MSAGPKLLKANKVLEGKPCGWCKVLLILGEDAAVCEACKSLQHAQCWNGKGGCSAKGCLNSPLERLPEPEAKQQSQLPPGKMECPSCKRAISDKSEVCAFCKAIVSDDGVYHGPNTNAPGAVSSLVWGILSLLICGIILGPVAISQSSKATQAIKNDPRLGGQGMATAGKVLGIIGLVGGVIMIAVNIAMRANR